MTKGHRTIVALLAAVAVLLGLNLLNAQPRLAAAAAAPDRLVAMTVDKDRDGNIEPGTYRVFRAWSDGHVDMTWVKFAINPNLCAVADQCGPVPLIP